MRADIRANIIGIVRAIGPAMPLGFSTSRSALALWTFRISARTIAGADFIA
jgi:hypothetical protein